MRGNYCFHHFLLALKATSPIIARNTKDICSSIGEMTHHHDHAMTSVSFSTIKIKVNALKNPMPLLVVVVVLLIFLSSYYW